MPAFGQIAIPARGVLLDQAATWDLLTFQRPSDAARLWNRVWPLRYIGEPHGRPNSNGIVYAPDPTWTPTANAISTLFACFPGSVWDVDDPLVYAERHSIAWQWQNYSGWDGFLKCVPHGAFFEDTRPDQAGLDALRRVLSEKFTAALSADGCRRPGPDDCMLQFLALSSLDPRNPRLPKLLQIIERSVDLEPLMAIPEFADSANRDGLSAEELKAIEIPEAVALRKIILLTLKIPLLLKDPSAWPPGELGRVLSQATDLSILLARIQVKKQFRYQRFERYYSNPWQWIDAGIDSATSASQRKLGSAYAGREACAIASLQTKGGTASFWQGYIIENIRLGHGDCGRFNALQLTGVYQTAMTAAKISVSEQAFDVFSSIKTALTTAGPVHDAALDELAATCAQATTVQANDIWHLCEDVRARDVAVAEGERLRIAAELAAMPPVDPLACADDVIARAASALDFSANDDYWSSSRSACRLDPVHAEHAIVALVYVSGEENGAEPVQADIEDFDLDVVILNLDDDKVIAHRHDSALIPSDAVQFEGISIDTARYQLARNKRAFGIRTTHSAQCHFCNFGYADMTLYLVNGRKIDSILAIRTSDTQDGEFEACPDAVALTTNQLAVGKGSRHGLADLVVTSITVDDSYIPDSQDDSKDGGAAHAVPARCPSPQPLTTTLRFDGRKYVIPASASSLVPYS
ncbi:MAG: hypothetical protein ABIR27_11320 [Dokdonella sp.]